MTKGSLFWHFDSKRYLYVECVRQTILDAFGRSDHHIKATDPEERLHQYLQWVMPAMSKSRVARRLILRIIIDQDTEVMQELMQGPFGESYATFMRILDELKPRRDKTALSFFVFAIFAMNDELLELAKVWEPKSSRRVGGSKSIEFVETLIKSW